MSVDIVHSWRASQDGLKLVVAENDGQKVARLECYTSNLGGDTETVSLEFPASEFEQFLARAVLRMMTTGLDPCKWCEQADCRCDCSAFEPREI